MVENDTLKRILVENAEFAGETTLTPRPLAIEQKGNYVFTGPRRAGKSFLMLQLIQNIMKEGGTQKDFLYVRFEDERLIELDTDGLERLVIAHSELYGAGKPTVFLDEIQVVPGWEKFVRRLADSKYRVLITGSNAQVISSEIASQLGGRFLIQKVFPYSFAEFLAANGCVFGPEARYGRKRIEQARLFETWFSWGGFPEIVLYRDKRLWLENLYQKIFYGDIMARYEIRNGAALRLLVKKLAESVGSEMSVNRMRNIIASIGISVGKSTIIDYLTYLVESYMVIPAENGLKKLSEREQNKKYYFVDNGILSLFIPHESAMLLENMVAIELSREGHAIRFAKDGAEIDFYVEETETAIQVCHSLSDSEILQREIKSLFKINETLRAKYLVIITKDEDRDICHNGKTVNVVSIQNWLMNRVHGN
ncbi:MAG: ATP-binding protein [Clostridiales Family XIII bacterium]|jgi:predicted AAA+ superfamily ATPase|nr:ATP-binding protein [Clostridiales Family XIII bacterium]